MYKVLLWTCALSLSFSAHAQLNLGKIKNAVAAESASGGGSLKYKKAATAERLKLNTNGESDVSVMEHNCGFKMPTDFDDNMIPVFEKDNASVAGHCDKVHLALSALCSKDTDGSYKKAIKGKIKKIQCKLSKSKEESSTIIKMNGGTLEFYIYPMTPNLTDFAVKWLDDNL